MPRTGRPKKPEGEKFVGRHIKFPPALWEQLETLVPEKQRAGFIRDAISAALKRLMKAQKDKPENGGSE